MSLEEQTHIIKETQQTGKSQLTLCFPLFHTLWQILYCSGHPMPWLVLRLPYAWHTNLKDSTQCSHPSILGHSSCFTGNQAEAKYCARKEGLVPCVLLAGKKYLGIIPFNSRLTTGLAGHCYKAAEKVMTHRQKKCFYFPIYPCLSLVIHNDLQV